MAASSSSSAAAALNVPSASSSSDVVQFASDVVSKLSGVQLGERQRSMVQSRMSKHLSDLGLRESEYIAYFHANSTVETQALLSLLTTHHSYFFREYSHFEYLETTALPALVQVARKRGDATIRLWSAACSRGQEVYSLAMCMYRYLTKNAPDVKFEILGTDVDEKSVEIGKNGVYLRGDMKEIPMPYLDNHWVRGQGEISEYVKAKKSLRGSLTFQKENLFDLSAGVKSRQFDIIFCRNVFIYFDQGQIQQVSNTLVKALSPPGYLFVGISESLRGLSLPVESPGPSIYRHPTNQATNLTAPSATKHQGAEIRTIPRATPVAEAPRAIRVVCVDDSPSILALLKKGLTKEFGFEVVGVAINGQDAKEKILALKPDVVTLDIHMPIQGGLEYLAENMGRDHPPVVMVSAVSRENADLALKAVRLGAVDYVEKPSIANMAERSEEIRNKLKSAYRSRSSTNATVSAIDQEFQSTSQDIAKMRHTDKKLRLIVARSKDQIKLKYVIKGLTGSQPPTVILLDEDEQTVTNFSKEFNLPALKDGAEPLASDKIYVGSLSRCHAMIMSYHRDKQASIVLFGEPTTTAAKLVMSWQKKQLLLEDLGSDPAMTKYPEIMRSASDFVPHTSFPYLSSEYLNGDDSGDKTK